MTTIKAPGGTVPSRLPPTTTTPASTTAAARGTQATADAGKARSTASTFDARKAARADPQWSNRLDALWASKRYAEIVDHIDQHIAPLKNASFASLDGQALGGWVEELYILQHRAIAVANKISNVEQPEAAKKSLELLQTLGNLQTAVFRQAVALNDAKDPNPIGAWVVYRNTMKKPGFHSATEEEQYFVDKARKFIDKGGDLSQINTLSLDFLKGLQSDQLSEWVVDAYDTARIARADTEQTPGHTLLSWGGDALAAGSLKVFKDDKGDISQVVVGTYSGHFRSGMEALHHMVRHLVAVGVPPERIKVQEGEAASSRTLELVNRLTGLSGADAQAKESALLAEATRWNPYAQPAPEPPAGPKAQEVGKRPAADAAGLNEALLVMKQTTKSVLEDGMVLQALDEGQAVAEAVDKVLTLAEKAGDPAAYKQGLAVLKHLAGLPAASMDADASKILKEQLGRWEQHAFGTGAVDAADVLSPRPVAERRARIVATLNPKVDDVTLREMLTAGMDVARLNTAHGTPEEHLALIGRVRAAAASLGRPIQVEIDLSGPKIRLGTFANPKQLEFNDIILNKGDKITLTTAKVEGSSKLLPVEYATLAKDVKAGEPVYLNDGTVALKALSVKTDAKGHGVVEAEVVQGGKVWDRKGINLPGSTLSVKTITAEDLAVLDKLLPAVDIVAPSFVRSAGDVMELRAEMQKRGRVVPIVAKIERPEALANLEQIAAVADGMMVARGDLGVEIGLENVPAAERKINEAGNRLGKPVMVATEVLMSMVKDSRPTRADVDALYSAVHDQGADAIMLAKETSAGSNPAEVIRAASRIISKAEEDKAEEPFTPERLKATVEGPTSVRDLMLRR